MNKFAKLNERLDQHTTSSRSDIEHIRNRFEKHYVIDNRSPTQNTLYSVCITNTRSLTHSFIRLVYPLRFTLATSKNAVRSLVW